MAMRSPALLLLLILAVVAFEELVSSPSCRPSVADGKRRPEAGELRVMMVADLMLLGSDSSFVDTFFRIPFFAKFFTKSILSLKPDLLVVLGDISAKGWEITESKWLAVLQQFVRMLGPFDRLPLHIVLGDRDIGECTNLNWKFVSSLASHLPGSESSGCSAFEVGNVSFVSLNSVALLCGNNELRFSVEKLIERESVDFRNRVKDAAVEDSCSNEKNSNISPWRENNMSSGSGRVLLLHFPLHRYTHVRTGEAVVHEENALNASLSSAKSINSGSFDIEPYSLDHTLPANATDYILQALRPSIIFNAHAHYFDDHDHIDGIREITVPAMTWARRGKPGFVLVTFGQTNVVDVSYCNLTQQSFVIAGYASLFVFSMFAVKLSRFWK